MVLVLTGPVHGGKTTLLMRSLPLWAGRGLACTGFVSPAVTDEDGASGYDLLEIPSGRSQPYLRRRGLPGAERVGPYAFVPAALERARAIIRGAGPSGLLVVDEVGPLELRGGGLWPALRDALAAPECRLLLVVRREILADFRALVAPRAPVVLEVGDASTPRLLEERLFKTGPTDDRQG